METDRLIIDYLKESDKEDYFNNVTNDKKVLETFICTHVDKIEDFDFSKYLGREDLFAIRLKESGKLIGLMVTCEEKETSCEIGYCIGSRYWGNGYATEAVKRFIKYLFEERGFETVYASFFTGNYASKHVMEKCGMTYSHFNEKELEYLGVERDLTYYKITKQI